jgi:hypothetical protein
MKHLEVDPPAPVEPSNNTIALIANHDYKLMTDLKPQTPSYTVPKLLTCETGIQYIFVV